MNVHYAEVLRRVVELEREALARRYGPPPAYDPADFPGFTRAQIEADLLTPVALTTTEASAVDGRQTIDGRNLSAVRTEVAA